VIVTSVHLEVEEQGPTKARRLVGAKIHGGLDLATLEVFGPPERKGKRMKRTRSRAANDPKDDKKSGVSSLR